MPYSAEVSRRHPGLLVFLIDQSTSMSDPCNGTGGQSKAAFLADVINRALLELVTRASKGDEVRHYFDLAVLAYGGRDLGAKPALSGDLKGQAIVSLSDLAYKPVRVETRKKKESDGAGGIIESEFEFPIWVDAVSDGYTPMRSALADARSVAEKWAAQHPDSFPPIVLNITDGESTDGDPSDEASLLRNLMTRDGNVLLFNCHISSVNAPAISFPTSEGEVPNDDFARTLFSMSSMLPDSAHEEANKGGYRLGVGAKGFVFNADAAAIFGFIDIGTKTKGPSEMR